MAARAPGEKLLPFKNGRTFNDAAFRKHVWDAGAQESGPLYRKRPTRSTSVSGCKPLSKGPFYKRVFG
jgi:hypothetical protein